MLLQLIGLVIIGILAFTFWTVAIPVLIGTFIIAVIWVTISNFKEKKDGSNS